MGKGKKIPDSVKKRFKVTKNGKVLRRGSGVRHLNSKKSKKRQRRQKKMKQVKGKMAKKIKRALGKK